MVFCYLAFSGASAYIVTLSAPEKIYAGDPIIVNGTSNIPPGFSTHLILTEKGHIQTLAEQQVTFQQGGTFSATFSTDILSKGFYKVEIEEKNEYPYGSSSKTWILFELIDRRNELKFTSSSYQSFSDALQIIGTIEAVGSKGLKVTVEHNNAVIFGPEYISTTTGGGFNKQISIQETGLYLVSLTDDTNYTWKIQVNVFQPQETSPTVTLTTRPPSISENAMASRNEPAFFKVISNIGTMRAYTSPGIDWVVEYVDESKVRFKVNTRGTAPEEVTLQSNGGAIYFKIYPDKFEERAEVILYIENAQSITRCPTCITYFGEAVTTPQKTPLNITYVIVGLSLLIILRKK